ncbi:MAG: amidohydrolase family protein, partial [Thermodesulfobacteriota bacterium]
PHPTIERIGSLHWNAAVHPEKEAALLFKPDEKTSEKLRAQGFTVVQSSSLDGIFRGSSVVVDLGDGLPNDLILNKDVAQFISFQKGSSNQDYPSSLMGSIALIRQTLDDAQWYQKAQQAYQLNPAQTKPEQNAALAALESFFSGTGKGVFAVGDELSLLRAARIAQEFGINLIYKASGYEYRRLQPIQALNATLIVPLSFPEAPNVATPEAEADVSLADLKTWDTAPENPGRLEKAKVRFAFTSNSLKEGDNFLEKVRESIKRGLSEKKAMAALTTVPAEICGVSDKVGTLEKGKMANFIIASDSIFSDKAKIYTVWIRGKIFEINPKPEVDPRGTWEVTLQPNQPRIPLPQLILEVSGKIDAPEGQVIAEAETVKVAEIKIKENKIQFSLEGDSLKMPGTARFTGRIEKDKAGGMGTLGDGSNFKWSSTRTKPYQEKPDTTKKEEEKVEMASFETVYPDKAFGR